MVTRSLEALGLDAIAAQQPLRYPGGRVSEPALLHRDKLLPLRPLAGPLGGWQVDGSGRQLDEFLTELDLPPTGKRVPVMAVGSNGSPGQMRHKLTSTGLTATVPMVPVRVTGIAVGVSAHVSVHGYVSASPYLDGARESTLVTSWLDADQLRAIDASEALNFRRVKITCDRFPMRLASGTPLPVAYLYANIHGVLALDGRTPHPTTDQHTLLTELLAASPQLHELLGPTPQSWVQRAAATPQARTQATQLFKSQGWTLPQPELLSHQVHT
ncbi:hypothetical protein ACFOSC_04005 [Streptantibioticus rubrisoli]|uniref:Uncharacterized protein n=1 Tax=Streptantibioticus rubrisoli TaxID=1387313 RepID=A0ABT1PM78_9ACTN|nr:hypothetical protein [Streptantibioticus rubrisoli]MCQ4045343.1 hypothetical protein [Streptantibioticus rubrisoli]